ncbi:hypothetical protein GRI89_03395 [Altererythrobacter salegens]|uniref:GAF domain-containing protein n=1 Tax=Croceibacterium salegens TaxID=1737568 RepID=A0A6I4SU38_9SPHN|nr:hypothetical protein [Croceibacterium salegens]MXO58587.1 hypothetical protein [Croceibacterium salegens]
MLNRFVAAADHFGETEGMTRSFVEELSRFAGGSAAALYISNANGEFGLTDATNAAAAASSPDTDPALAMMRAERGPLSLREVHSDLTGALPLPMLHQGELTGFVLFDIKPEGHADRPDELELLTWATQQVAFAL